jgi:hypothetical protein
MATAQAQTTIKTHPLVNEPQAVVNPKPLSAIEQAVNMARLAQRAALLASRQALKAADAARDALGQALSSDDIKFKVITNSQGYRYAGGWRGKRPGNKSYHGFGVLSWPNGNRYEGGFLLGRKNGYGVFSGGNGDHYQGVFIDGEIGGYGQYQFPDGNRYEGEFRHGYRHGYGVMVYADGEHYEGEWRDNEKRGYGILYAPDGKQLQAGIW